MNERGARILVIDDHPINLKLMRVLLESEGYTTITAASAEVALAILEKMTADLILTDIQLPEMDGLELTRKLKSEEATAAVPIVAVSAFAHADDRARALDAGCSAYLSKPLDTPLFYATIARLIPEA